MKRSDFTIEVIKRLGGFINPQRVAFGVAWAAYENNHATNNPWSTTQPYPGSTDYNSDNVKNYATIEDGINATVETLTNGYYNRLVNAFKDETSTLLDLMNALDSSPWGSTVTTVLYVKVVENMVKYDTEIDGSVTTVTPTVIKDTPSEENIDKESSKFNQLPILKLGTNSPAVLLVTGYLKYFYPEINLSEEYTKEVEDAVIHHQELLGLATDGIVGQETWASFFI
jgi:hypothetical protein